jgi:hypothetical protein
MGPAAKFRAVEFTGRAEDFPQWKMKFVAYLDTMDLRDVLLEEGSGGSEFTKKNRMIYIQQVLLLDKTTLRRIASCPDDGRKAWRIICDHFRGTDKLRSNNHQSRVAGATLCG